MTNGGVLQCHMFFFLVLNMWPFDLGYERIFQRTFYVWEFLNHLGMKGEAWGMLHGGMLGFP